MIVLHFSRITPAALKLQLVFILFCGWANSERKYNILKKIKYDKMRLGSSVEYIIHTLKGWVYNGISFMNKHT